MANKILEPACLEIIQRESAYREQLRQQQLEQELELTNGPQPEQFEPTLEPHHDLPDPMGPDYDSENHPIAPSAPHEPGFPEAPSFAESAAHACPPRPARRGGRASTDPTDGRDVSGAALFPGFGKGAGFRDRGRRLAKTQEPIRLEYHSPQCTICNHPEREDIERAVLHWHSPTVIAYEFDLPDRRIVYRHAHALGLFQLRAQQSRHALGFLIEQAQSIVPTADAIIRAIRALACIDDHGQWHEPRKEVIITHRYEDASVPNGEGDSPNAPPTPPRTRHLRRRSPKPTSRSTQTSAKTEHISQPDARVLSPLACPDAAASRGRVTSHSFTLRRDRAEGPLPLRNWSRFKRASWSTRLLSKFRRNSNPTNKTPKIGRHTFRSDVAPARREVEPKDLNQQKRGVAIE